MRAWLVGGLTWGLGCGSEPRVDEAVQPTPSPAVAVPEADPGGSSESRAEPVAEAVVESPGPPPDSELAAESASDEQQPDPSTPDRPAPAPPPISPSAPVSKTQVVQTHRGLRWTTDAWIVRPEPGQLALAVQTTIHNVGRTEAPASLRPPRYMMMSSVMPEPGGEGVPSLGVRGEGQGSDVCSPGHGGPAKLRPDDRHVVERTIELDPLPWPPGQVFEVTLDVSDCRGRGRSRTIAELRLTPPSTPSGDPAIAPMTE